jgi:hypothetical protein
MGTQVDTFSKHTINSEFKPIAGMNQRMEEPGDKAAEHLWVRLSFFRGIKVDFRREDVLFNDLCAISLGK